MSYVQTDGADGTTALDDLGNTVDAAGIYDDSNDEIGFSHCVSIYNTNDFYLQSNGGGSALNITSGDYSDAANIGIDLYGGGTTAIDIRGNRIFNNTGAGVSNDGNIGVNVTGNHFEADNPDINFVYGVEGAAINGNLLSQHVNTSSTCFICANTTSQNYGLRISHNEFDLQGESSFTLTNAIDMKCDACSVSDNVIDAFLTTNETLPNYVTLESGSINNTVRQYSLGPNAQVTGKVLTVTSNVNDLANSYIVAGGDYYQNNATITGAQGLTISSEPVANDHRLEVSQSNGGFALGWYNHDNDLSCTFITGVCSLPWGLILGDGSANYFDFSGGGTGVAPEISCTGSDANVPCNIVTKGTGQLEINGAPIAATNLSNGVTGSGAVVLATSPTLITPNLGAATASSLTIGGNSVVAPLRATVTVTGTSLLVGACDSNTVTVTGATTTSGVNSAVVAVPQGSVGNGFYIKTRVSAANTVLVEVCAAVAGTPTTQVFNVSVF